jgi:tRNA A-37 threonylcarbamoyl transferase component Bud32
MFTQNRVARAPVQLSEDEIKRILARSNSYQDSSDEDSTNEEGSKQVESPPSAPAVPARPRPGRFSQAGDRDRLNSKSLSPSRSPLMLSVPRIGEPDHLSHLSLESSVETPHLTVESAVKSDRGVTKRKSFTAGVQRQSAASRPSLPLGSPARSGSVSPFLSHVQPGKILRQGSYTELTLLERADDSSPPFVMKRLKGKVSGTIEHDRQLRAAAETMEVEVRILHLLARAPNICHLQKEYTDNVGRRCLVLEHADGGSMTEWIAKNGGFEEALSRVFIAQIVIGLQFLHLKGIAHRDLKPDNLLMKGSKGVLIADFGLAVDKVNAHKGAPGSSACGSLEYMPPEVARGCEHGYSVDCWSLGVLVYEMLMGEKLFSGNSNVLTPVQLLVKVQRGEYSLRSAKTRLSKSAIDMLCHLLQSDPLNRLSAQGLENAAFFHGISFSSLRKSGTPEDEISEENTFEEVELTAKANIYEYNIYQTPATVDDDDEETEGPISF